MILDIGGEGRHPEAWNLNPSRVKTLGRGKGEPIPRLIRGRADAIPLVDGSVHQIVVERTPLTRSALREIARVIAPGGTVILRHVPLPDFDPHAVACEVLPGPHYRRNTVLHGASVQETCFYCR